MLLAAGEWMVMLHCSVLLGGEMELRSMLFARGATAGGPTRIPLSLQTGETCGGGPLHDGQHPHHHHRME